MEHPTATSFRATGYASIATNSTYDGGLVRQHNRISFSRVFQAGHAVGTFQPETVSQIFDRVMFDKDVATGNISIMNPGNATGNYSTTGLRNAFGVKNKLTEIKEHECYVLDAVNTCDEEEKSSLANGTAIVKDWILTRI